MRNERRRPSSAGRGIGLLALLANLALLASSCVPTSEEPLTPPQRPNVLLVVLDTTRADVLSCYGHPGSTTPNIDALAAEGILFRRAYATSFWTLPSHASLLTGLYPSEAGATSETNHLPDRATTIAERLEEAGYRTGAVVRNAWISSERGFAQGFGDFVEAWRGDDTMREARGEAAAVDSAVAWLDAAIGGPEPFFLFVNLNIAHLPYTPPDEACRPFRTEAWTRERTDRVRSIAGGWGHLAGALHLDDTDYDILRGLYAGEVVVADRLVGRLVDALGARAVLDDTLVIVTSDHGENLGDHGLIDHVYSMYDTTTRVPLVIRYPASFTPGSVADDLVSLVDLAATILDACRALEPENDRARSLCNPLRTHRTEVYAENGRPVNGLRLLRRWFPAFDSKRIDHPMRMVRTGHHKLIWKVGSAAELYDLAADPGELADRSTTEPELRNRLLISLRTWSAGLAEPAPARPFTSRDTESLERLRALGYVD